jgi:hypothetical protein
LDRIADVNSKRTAREIADWCIGPRLQETLRGRWSRLATQHLRENRALKGRHVGEERCFIIGNGPSLKDMDLKPLADEYTIAANSFYKHPDAGAINLDYLCINDPHFMQDEPRSVSWHQTITSKLPTASLILNEAALPLVTAYHLYPGQEVHYVRSGPWTHRATSINLDLSLPLNIGMTTGSSVAIPLALCLGFREIYLIGFDCNWLADTSASYHFYQTHEHFPEFDSVVKDSRGFSYEDELRSALREFESHRLLRQKAKSLGARIVNATEGGFLDVYERREFAECFSEDTKDPVGRHARR